MNIREIGKNSGIENLLEGEKVLLNNINQSILDNLVVVAYVDRDQERYPGFVVAARTDEKSLINLYGFTKNSEGEWKQYLCYDIGKWRWPHQLNPNYIKYNNLLKERGL